MHISRNCSLICACLVVTAGCSIKRMAINKIGNALASGGSTYETDDDPELVANALPFGLKLIESLLAESPRHRGLLLAAASGFTEYSYAFVAQPADEAAADNLDRGHAMRARARRLYRRAHSYGLRGLELRYPGFGATLEREPRGALARIERQDVPLLYWTAASLGLAISTSKDDPEMIARLPLVDAMIHRAMELDESWGSGSVPEFLISIEGARTGARPAEKQEKMRRYFERALDLSKGSRAGLYLSYAENACVPAQDRAQFESLLHRALDLDPNEHLEGRLANLVAQRRARWLLGRIDELFLDPSPAGH